MRERFGFIFSGGLVVEQRYPDSSGVRRGVTSEYRPGGNRPVAKAGQCVSELDQRFPAIVADLVGSGGRADRPRGKVFRRNVFRL